MEKLGGKFFPGHNSWCSDIHLERNYSCVQPKVPLKNVTFPASSGLKKACLEQILCEMHDVQGNEPKTTFYLFQDIIAPGVRSNVWKDTAAFEAQKVVPPVFQANSQLTWQPGWERCRKMLPRLMLVRIYCGFPWWFWPRMNFSNRGFPQTLAWCVHRKRGFEKQRSVFMLSWAVLSSRASIID